MTEMSREGGRPVSRRLNATDLPALADLLERRPDVAGIGLTDVLDLLGGAA